LVKRASEFLDRAIEETEGVSYRIDVTVQKPEVQYEAELRLDIDGHLAHRHLADPDCIVLADAVAFVVASALDPLASYERARPLAELRSESEAPAPAPVAAESQPESDERPSGPAADEPATPKSESKPRQVSMSDESAPLEPSVVALIEARRGITPSTAFGVGLGGRFELARFWTSVVALAYLPRDATYQAGSLGTLPTLLLLDSCFALGSGRVKWPLCARLEGGAVRGAGARVSDPRTTWLPWFAAGLSAWAAVDLDEQWRALAGFGIMGAIARPRFLLSGVNTYEADPVSISASVGAQWRFR
jgi:hypothetical protein